MNSDGDDPVLRDRVTPFGYLRVTGCLSPHRSFSQIATSFIDSSCLGIHHMPLVATIQSFRSFFILLRSLNRATEDDTTELEVFSGVSPSPYTLHSIGQAYLYFYERVSLQLHRSPTMRIKMLMNIQLSKFTSPRRLRLRKQRD